MFHFHLGLEAAGAVQIIGGRDLTTKWSGAREKGMGSKATYTDRRIHGTRGFLELGPQGKERVGALRFLESTANRQNDAHHRARRIRNGSRERW